MGIEVSGEWGKTISQINIPIVSKVYEELMFKASFNFRERRDVGLPTGVF